MKASCSGIERSLSNWLFQPHLRNPCAATAALRNARPRTSKSNFCTIVTAIERPPIRTQNVRWARCFSSSNASQAGPPQKSKLTRTRPAQARPFETGVALPKHRQPLKRDDLLRIFKSSDIDGTQGLRLLQVLQGRRVNGTLDLPLPPDLARLVALDISLITNGLGFLRSTYPLDEDAAIMRRIKTEEAAAEQASKALEKERFQPQSGHFGAKRGENDSIWGVSYLEKLRKRNQEAARLAHEEDDRMIDELDQNLKKLGKPGGLIRVEEQDLSLGRPITTEDIKNNLYLRWKIKHSMQAMSHITPEAAAQMSIARRLLPSAAFTALFLLGMYWYSQTWYEPSRLERFMPNTPIAVATVAGIISANVAVFVLWKIWPPAWKHLNKYFISTPGYPYALSMLGNTFSHQRAFHLLVNMAGLWWIGTRLHEELGRGTFLALYLSSGVFGSFAGLLGMTLRKHIFSSSLGASGCLTGVLGTYLSLHSKSVSHLFSPPFPVTNRDLQPYNYSLHPLICNPQTNHRDSDKMTIAFLPHSYQENFNLTGTTLLLCFLAVDLVGLGFMRNTDNVAHLGGYLVGILSAWWMKRDNAQGEGGKKKKNNVDSVVKKWFGV